jgi:hypothetical protein
MAIDTTSPRSRRAILIGALGGTIAAAAATVGRANPVGATNGDTVKVGGTYTSTTMTEIDATGDVAFRGSSNAFPGVWGNSDTYVGVQGTSASSNGVFGNSNATDDPAILGQSPGSSTGVQGFSGSGGAPTVPRKTGVHGFANQDVRAIGVKGQSPKGRGGVFVGGKAQLRLVPSAATLHPTSGALGDLFLDHSGRLWLCKGSTTWVKLG